MLKAWLVFLTLTISVVCAFAQDVSIYDIQYTTNPSGTSPDSGATVTTGGFVTGVDYLGSQFNSYFLSDRPGGLWHGILVRDLVHRDIAVGDSIAIRAQVSELSGMTRLISPESWEIYHEGVVVPPAVISCSALGEPTEGVLVELQNVTVSTVSPQSQEFTVTDGTAAATITNGWSHVLPAVGDTIVSLRGIVTSAGNVFKVNPRNDFDLVFHSNRAPVISELRNYPAVPNNMMGDTIKARMTDETVVADARVCYRFGSSGSFDTLSMFDDGMHGDSLAGDHVWGAIIPPNAPRAVCYYYVWASDDSGKSATMPSTAPQATLSFAVSPCITEIYDHYSTYDNASVTLTGVVNFVEDVTTSGGTRRISAYLQDISGRGFYLSQSGAASTYPGIVRGNFISIRGIVTTYSGAVQLGSFASSDVFVHAYNQPMPAPIEVKTGDRFHQADIIRCSNSSAHASGTWCKLTGTVYRVDENVGGGTNIAIDDGTGATTIRVWDSMNIDSITLGSDRVPLRALAGKFVNILGPASFYNTDFQLLGGGSEGDFELPTFGTPTPDLTLDIPNRPFAPEIGQTLKISYNAPALGAVRVRIFDLRGRLVRTLVDKLSGGPNVIQWDGRNELNELLPIGTYVVHLESVQSGKSNTKIKPIVVGMKL